MTNQYDKLLPSKLTPTDIVHRYYIYRYQIFAYILVFSQLNLLNIVFF